MLNNDKKLIESKKNFDLRRSTNSGNGVRIVNFVTSKNLVVKSTIFPHRNIHNYTWTSPDEKTHNKIDHILIERRRHSSILDVRSFRGADVILITIWWLQN